MCHGVVRTDVPQHPEIWKDLCGSYELRARLIEARVQMMMGAGVQVFVRGGQLMLRILTPIPALYRGFALHPDDADDPYVFPDRPLSIRHAGGARRIQP